MSLIFLLLLATALGSFFLFTKTSSDVFRCLAVATVAVCLIWGIAIAPWQVQLLVLIGTLSLKQLQTFARAFSLR